MKKTVLILGAGASYDYGYPLWDGLKEQMIQFNIGRVLKDELNLPEDNVDAHRNAHNEFIEYVGKYPDATLDSIVYEIDKDKSKHLNPTGHLLINIAGYILAQYELVGKDGGWVTALQDILVDYMAEQSNHSQPNTNMLSNLTVVSLNYDRVFEYYITNDFYVKLLDNQGYSPSGLRYSIEYASNNQLELYKPHGFICMLQNKNDVKRAGMNIDLNISGANTHGIRYPGSYTVIPYGDKRITSKDTFLKMGRYMYVVDERDESDYRNANQAVKNADIVICLGLSSDGICQSSLHFQNEQQVYLSNKKDDLSKIDDCKPGPNYQTIENDGKRLDASAFPGKFKEIVFA